MGWIAGKLERLSDHQRRLVCRWGFVVGALLPLLLILGVMWRSDSRATWEARCQAALGLETRIAQVSTPRPGCYVFDDVELSDPEAGWVARIKQVRLTRHEQRWSLLIDHTTVRPELLAQVWARLARCLDIPAAREDDIELAMRGVHWSSDEHATDTLASWDRITWYRKASPDSVSLVGQLTPAGATELSPIELRFERARSVASSSRSRLDFGEGSSTSDSAVQEPVTTNWSLRCTINTHEHSVDLAWLTLGGWQANSLGDEAAFTGAFEYRLGIDGTVSCEMVGSLLDVDLRHMVGDRFRHTMEGRATVHCSRLRIEQGRLMELAGSLESDGGIVGMPLLKSLATQLQLDLGTGLDPESDASTPFRHLGIRFDLTGETLGLSGFQSSALLFTPENRPLLSVGGRLSMKPQDLIRALVPESRFQVPLTRETVALMQWFPLPRREELEPNTTRLPRGIPSSIDTTRYE